MARTKGIWYQHLSPRPWTPEYPRCSMFDQLSDSAKTHPDWPAMKFRKKRWCYRQLIDQIEGLAGALLSVGIRRGDMVSIVSPNIPQAVMMLYALNRIGAVANMIHPSLSPGEIRHFVETVESAALLIPDTLYDSIAGISWTQPRAPKIILAGMAAHDASAPGLDVLLWQELLKRGTKAALPPDGGDPDALAVILYSGGTTGIPKGVMITNFNLTSYAIQVRESSGVELAGKRSLALLPLFHGFGLALCVHTMLCAGACIYLVPACDFKECNALIFRKRLHILCGVPAFFESLSRYPDMEGKDLSFLECLISGGDALPEKLQRRISRQLKAGGSKAALREGYGLTESLAGCCINPVFRNVPGSVGLPCPDMEAKIVELGTCREVPDGADGELCIAGPTVMRGYYRDREATRQVLRRHDDGKVWLHTGDIFCKDADGYLFFRQRIGRMIVCAGYNVYLSQIEHALASCEIVEAACAVGIRDRVMGNQVGVFVILGTPMEPRQAAATIMEYCRRNMAEYALPRRIDFVDEFPRTKLGKVDFRALEKRMNGR